MELPATWYCMCAPLIGSSSGFGTCAPSEKSASASTAEVGIFVVTGSAVAGTAWDVRLALTAALGFVVVACLWWMYFDHVDEQAVQRLAARIREQLRRDDLAHLRFRETELVADGLVREREIVAAEVVARIHEPHDAPVESAPRAIAGRQFWARLDRRRRHCGVSHSTPN